MKTRITKKEVVNSFTTVEVGYCNLQKLLSCEEESFFTNRTFGKKVSYDLIKSYEEKAKKVCEKEYDYKKKKKKLNKLIYKFIEDSLKD